MRFNMSSLGVPGEEFGGIEKTGDSHVWRDNFSKLRKALI